MATGTRLAIGLTIVLGVTAYMAYVGASSSWQYYLTVDECMDSAPGLGESRIRVTGNVAGGSLQFAEDRSSVTFTLEGTRSDLAVSCAGAIPDNLAEGRQVVVEGCLQNDGHLVGDKVFTRCASKYSSDMPQEGLASSELRLTR